MTRRASNENASSANRNSWGLLSRGGLERSSIARARDFADAELLNEQQAVGVGPLLRQHPVDDAERVGAGERDDRANRVVRRARESTAIGALGLPAHDEVSTAPSAAPAQLAPGAPRKVVPSDRVGAERSTERRLLCLGKRELRHTQMLTLTTRDGDLDLLVDPPGSPGYPALRRHADIVGLDGDSVRIASHRWRT